MVLATTSALRTKDSKANFGSPEQVRDSQNRNLSWTIQGGHLVGVEIACHRSGILKVPVHVGSQARHPVDGNIADGFVPADVVVEFGSNTQRPGRVRLVDVAVRGYIPHPETRPKLHDSFVAEKTPVGYHLFSG